MTLGNHKFYGTLRASSFAGPIRRIGPAILSFGQCNSPIGEIVQRLMNNYAEPNYLPSADHIWL